MKKTNKIITLIALTIIFFASCKKDNSNTDRLEIEKASIESRGFTIQEKLTNINFLVYKKNNTLIFVNKKFFTNSRNSSFSSYSNVIKYRMNPPESIQSGQMSAEAPDIIDDSGDRGLDLLAFHFFPFNDVAEITITPVTGSLDIAPGGTPEDNWVSGNGEIDIEIIYDNTSSITYTMINNAINADPVQSFKYR